MQQHLGRQAGVRKVEVALESGKVAVELKDDSQFNPGAMLKAVFDSGVTVYEMIVTGSGRVTKDGTRLIFETAPNQSFEIVPNELSRNLPADSGKEISIRGRLYRKPEGKQKPKFDAPLKLEILEVLTKETAR